MTLPGERTKRIVTHAGVREVVLIAAIYLVYTSSRLLASDDFGLALHRARAILRFEKTVGIDMESWLNDIFIEHSWLGLLGSYWYSTAHYIVTLVVLAWLWRRSRTDYVVLRSALVVATVLGLVMYLLLPTAPPRFVEGYVDVLSLHSGQGWWGADASAPRGLGHLTNELAAFPSLHAGWSLWVALAISQVSSSRWLRLFGWAHAVITSVVIIGTANHWLLDAVVGWLVVLVGCVAVAPFMPIVEGSVSPRAWSPHASHPLGGPVPSADGTLSQQLEPGAGS